MADVEFKYDPTNFDYTPAMRRSFEENGFFYVRGLLPTDEIQKLQKAVTLNDFYKHSYGANDGDGKVSRLALFSYPGSDVTGTIARAEKVAGMAEKILGGEVYHYHSKIIMKDAFTGGQHIWHQDYGYWYNYGNLYPDLVTVYIAIDECKKDNGCLQVLRGSHKCGRIEHRRAAKQIDGVHYSGQHGADVERVQEIAKVCPLDYVELKPGDAIYFHCNLVHNAPANTSPDRRWTYLCCYNKATNDPVYKHRFPGYNKLDKVPDTAIMECTNFTDMTGKHFYDPNVEKN